ncbi:hypothetical protein AC578_4700 [Pseudocercospora eumusae]|uniref:Uncharacterized protein n=1 Tax=Pseudocercospora eumusae TaxID=321146 RepID=A0A139H7L3_9PEZI|nr:hypothetical protein AC578_4700 [Pseudocercospora eumusae]
MTTELLLEKQRFSMLLENLTVKPKVEAILRARHELNMESLSLIAWNHTRSIEMTSISDAIVFLETRLQLINAQRGLPVFSWDPQIQMSSFDKMHRSAWI